MTDTVLCRSYHIDPGARDQFIAALEKQIASIGSAPSLRLASYWQGCLLRDTLITISGESDIVVGISCRPLTITDASGAEVDCSLSYIWETVEPILTAAGAVKVTS